ncbi:MAG: ABC transporter substrate-binding protein, partial [Desulfobacteraceae bacterium]|nr:ABC transporter substrate-binding protein [Desulfobacteraceae bacterium]
CQCHFHRIARIKAVSHISAGSDSQKWRIGYYEAGAYQTYPKTLIAIVNGLADLGWIEPVVIPPQENDKDTDKLWAWLAANVRSKYLEFVPNAFYSYNWNQAIREQSKQTVIRRLKEGKDINLMIAMGTLAAQDLANNEHSVPMIVCSVSDAVGSKIIRSVEDSGYDHVHAHVDPTRYIRQIRSFHDIFGFKKLGVTFIDTLAGRSYAAIEDIRKVAKERNFEIAECYVPDGGATPEANAKVIECAKTLAPKIDAFYLTVMGCVNKETLPQIISAMNTAKIPTFSQAGGSDNVRQGVLLSIATPNFKALGKFHAEVIAKIINGAKPRELDQVFELPAKIAFNAAEAMTIGLKPDIFNLLSQTAEEVYKEIEKGK